MSWALLLVAAAILFFFLKYFTQESPQTQDATRAWVDRNLDHVAVMFPQIDRSAIAYDLSKTMNVEETIETLLAGRPLPACPRDSVYYRPTTTTTTTTAASSSLAHSEPTSKEHLNLVQRYNLQGRTADPSDAQYAWSRERSQREATLRKRKEDAVLRARQRLASTDLKESSIQATPSTRS
jgi:coupling of ubiquitin conjugation to ER degradation protein 1